MVPGPRIRLAAALAAGLALAAPPAIAETLDELDVLSDATADERRGIAMAQEQAARGDFLDAISTLERVLAAFPKSADARLLHATYLCLIDDRAGGAVELGKLKEKNYVGDDFAFARERCGVAGGS